MLKTNLEILDFIKSRLELAKKSKSSAAIDFLEEDYDHETISKNLANYQKEVAVQLVLESLINFIESDIK